MCERSGDWSMRTDLLRPVRDLLLHLLVYRIPFAFELALRERFASRRKRWRARPDADLSRCFFGGRTFRRNRDKKVPATVAAEARMPVTNPSLSRSGLWTQVLTDVHFWVPAIVLLAGLVVLHWIR
jgi:hypothetical protein